MNIPKLIPKLKPTTEAIWRLFGGHFIFPINEGFGKRKTNFACVREIACDMSVFA